MHTGCNNIMGCDEPIELLTDVCIIVAVMLLTVRDCDVTTVQPLVYDSS